MKKILKNGVIHIQKITPREILTRVGIIAALIFIVIGSIGLVLFQQSLKDSQDIRQQASIDDGKVLITTNPAPNATFQLNQPGTIDLRVNTQNTQVSGVQLVFHVVTSGVDTLNVLPVASSGLDLEYVEVERTQDGFLVALIALPNQLGSTFGTNTDVAFASLSFTPTANGSLRLAFDAEQSLSIDMGTDEDELRTIADVTYQFGEAIASATPSPVGSTSPSPTADTQKHPIHWDSNFIIIQATDFYTIASSLTANHVKLFQNPENVVISSNLVGNEITFEARWQENGREQRLQLFFVADRAAGTWSMTRAQVLTYRDNGNAEWITFTNPAYHSESGTYPIRARIGESFSFGSHYRFTTSSNGIGEVYFESVSIRPFFNGDHPGDGWTDYRQCNATCTQNSECGPNFRCVAVDGVARCRLGTDPTSESCNNPYPTASPTPGTGGVQYRQCNEYCSSSAECAPDYRCYNDGSGSRCRLANNVSSARCELASNAAAGAQCNEYCSTSSDCRAGFMCFTNRCRRPDNPDNTSCQVPSAQNQQQIARSCREQCGSNRDCGVNLRCYQGECRLASNPGSLSCSAGTTGSVSQTFYGAASKGGTTPGKGTDLMGDDQTTPSGSARPSGSPTSSVRPSAAVRPSSTPTPTSENGGKTLLDRLASFFPKTTSLPVLLLGAGLGILAIVLILAALTRRRREESSPVPPFRPKDPTTTKYENDLQAKINALKSEQARPGAPTPVRPITPVRPVSPVSPVPRPSTTAPTPGAKSGTVTIKKPASPITTSTRPTAASSATQPSPSAQSMMDRLKAKGIKPPQS
jgi:hypothetical protein